MCSCDKCNETKVRQTFIAREIAFHRRDSKIKNIKNGVHKTIKKIPEIKFKENSECETNATCEVRKFQMCARCRNHSQDHPIRGHKNSCPFSNCTCDKCEITTERRKIMAKQIRDYRLTKPADDVDSGYSGSPDEEREITFPSVEETSEIAAESKDSNSTGRIALTDEDEIFFMVQSLYEKFFYNSDANNKIEFLYALVLLTNKNWLLLNNALLQGKHKFLFIYLVSYE